MKKILTLAIFAFLLIFLFSTCPTKQDHRNRLRGAITQIISEKLNSAEIEDALTDSPEFQKLVEELGTAAVDVDNYFLFSIGKIDLNGKEQVVSFGIGGHVFTFNDKIVQQTAGAIKKIQDKF